MIKRLAWRLIFAVAALPLGLSFGSSVSQATGPYTLPAVSYITATEPATFFSPDTHLACLARSEQAGSTVTISLLCYSTEKPSPPPPPPPPPYGPMEMILTGSFNQSTGALLLPMLNCTVVYPGIAFSAAIGVQLDKAGSGSGSVVFTTDTAAPLDCDEPALFGPLTLTPLATDHDQDGDGCTDWEELGTDQYAGGLRDPFNFWDFYDTPDQNNVRDKVVDMMNDMFRVSDRFDATGDPTGDPLAGPIPPPPAYHTAFDRSPAIGPDLWNLGPPDGIIDLFNDVFAVADQFDHSCVAAP